MLVTDTCRSCGRETTSPLYLDELGFHTVCKHCGSSFDTDNFYRTISPEEASQIIDTYKPIGLYLCPEAGKFTGIDNSTGDAWTESFDDEKTCLLWLAGEIEKEDE